MFRYGVQEQLIPYIAPVDTTTSAATGAFVKVSNAHWLQFRLQFGNINDTTGVVTVEEYTANSTSGASTDALAIPFTYRLSGVVGDDTWGAVTTSDSGGYTVGATADNMLLIIDIDPRSLTDGYDYVRMVVTPSGTQTNMLIAATAALLPRYAQLDNLSTT